MKLTALKNCWIENKKRGVMVNLAIGEEVELDHTEKEVAEMIHNLFYGRKMNITDEKFIPENGKYIILRPFPYRTVEGFPRSGIPGAEISLTQEKACELLASYHVRPVDENSWSPSKLLEPPIKDNVIKRMFDNPLPEKEESWMGDWRDRRQGK
jgi:hypothetical protein